MFMCQRDSFLKQFETEVISCDLVNDADKSMSSLGLDPTAILGRKLYKLILKDTILFPEGGGQPDDRGLINEVGSVIRVVRSGTEAVHYVTLSADNSDINGEINSSGDAARVPWKNQHQVSMKIDWQRRFDHMQQHSGQHLITAVTDAMFGYQTTSWWLGSEETNVELDTKDLTEDQIRKIESEVNAKIRENVAVTVDVVGLDDPKLKSARGRNLPEDVKGNIRIVSMTGIESNVCCGTHVNNLSQIQVIKLLHVIKKKGKCLLHFVCGNRAIDRFSKMYHREQKLTEILKSSATDLPTAGEKLNVALKNVRKSNQVLSKDLVSLIAKDFKTNVNSTGDQRLWIYHRDNVDLDFGMGLLREVGNSKSTVLLITIKTEGNSGYFLLTGGELESDKEKLTQIGEQLCAILDGKGSVQRGNVYQAKVNTINAVNKAHKLAQELIQVSSQSN